MISPSKIITAIHLTTFSACRCLCLSLLLLMTVAMSATAQPVEMTISGLSEVEVGLKDLADVITVTTLLDDDNDGIIHFLFDATNNQQLAEVATPGGCIIWDIKDGDVYSTSIPILVGIPATGDLVTHFSLSLSSPPPSFAVGQVLSVSGGAISGWNDAIFRDASTANGAQDLLLIGDSLPLYTGEAQVEAIVSFVVVPEPGSGLLLLTGLAVLTLKRKCCV